MTIYCLRDVKAGTYGSVFAEQNDSTAIRNLSMLVNSPSAGIIYSHPEDFELFVIGDFDVDIGELQNLRHEFIKSCAELKGN